MLTREDLHQIELILDRKLEEKLEAKLEQKLEQKFNEKLAPIYQKLDKHEQRLSKHEKTLKEHTKLLKSLKSDQVLILDLLDKEQLHLRKRVDRIEQHLGLPAFI